MSEYRKAENSAKGKISRQNMCFRAFLDRLFFKVPLASRTPLVTRLKLQYDAKYIASILVWRPKNSTFLFPQEGINRNIMVVVADQEQLNISLFARC